MNTKEKFQLINWMSISIIVLSSHSGSSISKREKKKSVQHLKIQEVYMSYEYQVSFLRRQLILWFWTIEILYVSFFVTKKSAFFFEREKSNKMILKNKIEQTHFLFILICILSMILNMNSFMFCHETKSNFAEGFFPSTFLQCLFDKMEATHGYQGLDKRSRFYLSYQIFALLVLLYVGALLLPSIRLIQ